MKRRLMSAAVQAALQEFRPAPIVYRAPAYGKPKAEVPAGQQQKGIDPGSFPITKVTA